jgi:L,D-transpeptidase catalytic domain
MLKPIAYPAVMLIALLTMGHTKYPLVNNTNQQQKLSPNTNVVYSPVKSITTSLSSEKADYYKQWRLDSVGLSEPAFNYAMKGLDYLSKTDLIAQKNILSIVDFSQPSTQKRLYIIEISSGKILFNTWVAHGRNSGNVLANQFSNLPESHQSSLGFYATLDTYMGEHGYSLRLKGCEKGINDKAFERAIVIHGADYVSDRFINSRGILGRSYGCPAIPNELSKKIIDVIKKGSCLFLYHPNKKYITQSKVLNSQV